MMTALEKAVMEIQEDSLKRKTKESNERLEEIVRLNDIIRALWLGLKKPEEIHQYKGNFYL